MNAPTSGKSPAAANWIIKTQPNPSARLRLFCFPYAGGTALIYRQWPELLPEAVEVCAVQLPGRGNLLGEPPYTRLKPLAHDLRRVLAPHLDRPFAFFGHSMGATLCFEVARELRREGGPQPARLFVSGRRAPHVPNPERPLHDLPDAELFEELRRLNGTPAEVLEHPELMALILPLLRADFSVSESYVYEDEPPLDCPISVYGGLADAHAPREDLEAWRRQTTQDFALRMLEGDHFFINTARPVLLGALARELYRLLGELDARPLPGDARALTL
jgi:medium-chain acyl-[acyl-carrier-protein] hydrolase